MQRTGRFQRVERVRYVVRNGVRGGGAGARAGGVQVNGMAGIGIGCASVQLLAVEQTLLDRPSVLVGERYRVNRIDAGSGLIVVVLLAVYLRRGLLNGGIVGIDGLLIASRRCCCRRSRRLLLLPVLRRVAVEHVLRLRSLLLLLLGLRNRSWRHSLAAQRARVAYATVATRWLWRYLLARQRTAA